MRSGQLTIELCNLSAWEQWYMNILLASQRHSYTFKYSKIGGDQLGVAMEYCFCFIAFWAMSLERQVPFMRFT